jgi:hypothetical protein
VAVLGILDYLCAIVYSSILEGVCCATYAMQYKSSYNNQHTTTYQPTNQPINQSQHRGLWHHVVRRTLLWWVVLLFSTNFLYFIGLTLWNAGVDFGIWYVATQSPINNLLLLRLLRLRLTGMLCTIPLCACSVLIFSNFVFTLLYTPIMYRTFLEESNHIRHKEDNHPLLETASAKYESSAICDMLIKNHALMHRIDWWCLIVVILVTTSLRWRTSYFQSFHRSTYDCNNTLFCGAFVCLFVYLRACVCVCV